MDAYADFIDEASTGQFEKPTNGGWTAEQIVAHVTRNQEGLITVTERLLAGEPIGYDNHDFIDGRELDRYAASYGGLRGLVDRMAETVTVLRDLTERLDERGDTPVPVRIQDGDQIVIDQPMPWAGLLEHDAGQHVPMHLEQLRALRKR
jgi:hypothetical protein